MFNVNIFCTINIFQLIVVFCFYCLVIVLFLHTYFSACKHDTKFLFSFAQYKRKKPLHLPQSCHSDSRNILNLTKPVKKPKIIIIGTSLESVLYACNFIYSIEFFKKIIQFFQSIHSCVEWEGGGEGEQNTKKNFKS